jgi:large subunit ribosomal protein L30
MEKKIKVTLRRSLIGCNEKQKKVAKGLGLKKTGSYVVIPDTPVYRGMIEKIKHLLVVSEL